MSSRISGTETGSTSVPQPSRTAAPCPNTEVAGSYLVKTQDPGATPGPGRTEFVIIGGGGHASVVAMVLMRAERDIIGFTAPAPRPPPLGLHYLGTNEALAALANGRIVSAALGIGAVGKSGRRLKLMDRIGALGIGFPPIIANGAIVHDDVEVGAGTVILDGAVVITGARMGRGCIINTRASVDHDCVLGDDVHVAPGATLTGNVRVGSHCLIGAGATVIPDVSICAGAVIGAGATVVRDIHESGTYLGTPARKA